MTIVTKSPPVADDQKQLPLPGVTPDGQGVILPPAAAPASQPPVLPEQSNETVVMETAPVPESGSSAVVESAAPSNPVDDGQEPDFPHDEMRRLDDMINRPRWVVPVLHNGELEILLDAVIDLCRKGADTRSEACQHFFREGLTISFTKILTDEAVSGWKHEIHKCIFKNAEKLIELCVLKLDQDWFPLLDLLAMVLNPSSRFHMFNTCRTPESVPLQPPPNEDELYARPFDPRSPKGWLVDLVNHFGTLKGFQILLERFQKNLNVPVIAALIRPFGFSYEVLTTNTVVKFFLPIIDVVSKFMENLTDEELKKESKTEAKNDTLSGIINALKCLASRVPKQEDKIKSLEMFRLKIILRLLQISSFNGKMNALNEVNKLIANVTYNMHKHSQVDLDEWLTAEKVAEWIESNNVLSIVLRDNLHQPQYVEKLEKIVRFMIKEKALTLPDLDKVWEAQAGKHEAIVKNVHDLLAKLAWDFSPQQLDHLFECFQGSWANASKKQREKLLELIRRLAEDDKEGVMAHKVLGLLWNLAKSEDVSTDIMDQALAAHIKILDYSCSQVCSQDRDSQKTQWIAKFVEELKNDRLVLPALKQIREICQLFTEAPQNYSHIQRATHMFYRNKVINNLHQQFTIVMLVADSLTSYMDKAREYAKENPNTDPSTILPDGRFNHIQQVNDRLRFLRFLLKDGQLWLCKPQANQIWTCLAENAIYSCDRENCFKWYSKLMSDEPDLDPEITNDFFQQYVLRFDPVLLTESGMNCFERFFRHVNSKEGKFSVKRRGGYVLDDLNLIGVEYLWRVVSYSSNEVAEKGILLLKDIYTNLGPRLQAKQVEIHEDFLQDCMNRLKAMYDTISALERNNDNLATINLEVQRMIRILTVLRVYIAECDEAYAVERAILPLFRACRGKHMTLVVRFPSQGRHVEDIELWSHTNDTVGSLRRQLIHRLKSLSINLKAELYLNGELIDATNDRKLISHLGILDKTQLTAKLVQIGTNNPSSPDSSSGSSTGSLHNIYDGPNIEMESCLPGVLMATKLQYTDFLFHLSDLGCELETPLLRECAREILRLMASDTQIVEKLRTICAEVASQNDKSNASTSSSSSTSKLEMALFACKPSQVLYMLEVIYALLMPASHYNNEEVWDFQHNFMLSGGVALCLKMISSDTFLMNADLTTRRSAYLTVLKISKFVLTTVVFARIQMVAEAVQLQGGESLISSAQHQQAVLLQKAVQNIPNQSTECATRSAAHKLGQSLSHQVANVLPDQLTIRAIQKIAWSTSGECLHLVHSSYEEIHKAVELFGQREKALEHEDVNVCREALEVLTVCLALCPDNIEMIYKERTWQSFIIDLLLVCHSRPIRMAACEQFNLIATRCSGIPKLLVYFITLLFTVLSTTAKDCGSQSHEYFQLLCRLLNFAYISQTPLSQADTLLTNEIVWLKKVRECVLKCGSSAVEDALLEGHLGLTKELISLQNAQKKFFIGAENGGHNFIKELVEDFVFTASKVLMQYRSNQGDIQQLDQAVPVCTSPQTVWATFDLLVSLVTGCLQNLRCLADMLTTMFYTSNDTPLVEWEYIPPVGPRPLSSFVGLKNAGATCYMNSVIQQLFMIEPIRDYILAADGAADDLIEAEELDDRLENESNIDTTTEDNQNNRDGDSKAMIKSDERKDYNLKVLKYVQYIFAHLVASKMQYYVPKGFWKHFRLQGEPVNLREQHDALEFFNSLVDGLDEALKSLGYVPILTRVLGGSFADQKICKDCPHRYSREESFTVLNIDIRNQQNLLESLEQYVKGDLLEGANAYHCEKCNKKVDTVKRLCIKKLPPMLAIQLKRFDYDWERECAIKFNDYFEFPRELDMAPYTVQGLAKLEGELIADENEEGEEKSDNISTKYQLVGVVVHSGQASGGHYFSYILHRSGADQIPKWYKFDDGEVSECKMEDDEEMKNQCFGGEYLGEVFDHMLKRMSYRRQKRWWNAYILFYEQVGHREVVQDEKTFKQLQNLTIGGTKSGNVLKMPSSIESCVRRQNINFLHNRNQFCPEYFRFMRRLLACNAGSVQPMAGDEKLQPDAEEIAMISVQLISKFLFNIAFHTKKTLRGPANEWYDSLVVYFRHSQSVRQWFVQNILFSHPSRLPEFLLESPSTEVRNVFVRILVFLAHFSHTDGLCTPSQSTVIPLCEVTSLSDQILHAILQLLKKEVSEHGRHLTQYFHLFLNYSNLGIVEKQQLLNLNVPELFMNVSLDDGTAPPIKYQYPELSKLYAVVSQLIRCCDVSAKCVSSAAATGKLPLPNPHGEPAIKQPVMKIQTAVAMILYEQPSCSYVKKLIQECNNYEETTKLLKFCCWENPHFSSTTLSELLWQVAYSCTYELRPFLDLLLQMLLLEDSWQNHRIHNALKGIPEDRDGLFDTIHLSKNQYQKRAYQCIKMMVMLFTHCSAATEMLLGNLDIRRKWNAAVEWLQDELERRPYSNSAQYAYNWSSQVQSNETSNGYFLERSPSARLTLSKALELCPDENEPEEAEVVVDDAEHQQAPEGQTGGAPAAAAPAPAPPAPATAVTVLQDCSCPEPFGDVSTSSYVESSDVKALTSTPTPPPSSSPCVDGDTGELSNKISSKSQE